MSPLLIGAAAIGALLLGLLLGYGLEHRRLRRRKADAESEAARLIAAARQDVEQIQRAAELSGKEEAYRARQDWEREEGRRREEVERLESRVEERRSALDQKYDVLVERNRQLEDREKELDARAEEVRGLQAESQRLEQEARRKLEALAGLTAEEALRKLMQGLEDEARARAANSIREIKENARKEAEREARNIIALAIQRIAADHTAESTVSVVGCWNRCLRSRSADGSKPLANTMM